MNPQILIYILAALGALIALALAVFLIEWIVLFAGCFLLNVKKGETGPSKASHRFILYGYRLILKSARVKIHVKGLEKVPQDRRFLFISNHVSNFDNMIQSIALKKENLAFVSKPENFKIPIVNRAIKRNSYICLIRENPRSAFEMVRKSISYIENGITSIGIYPEGTRSKTGELLPFKPGCFKIAEKAKCPIVVSSLKNTSGIHKNWPFKRTHVYFEILKIYMPEDLKDKNTNQVCSEIESLVKESLSKPDFN